MNDENENNNLHNAGIEQGVLPEDNEDSVALESGRPAVASAPGKILVFLIAGAIFIAIVVKALFFQSAGPAENKVKLRPERVAPAQQIKSNAITPGELPTAPQQDADIGAYSSKTSPSYSSNGGDNSVPDLSKLPPPPTSGATPSLPSIAMGGALGGGAGGANSSPSIIGAPTLNPSALPTMNAGAALSGGGAVSPPPPPPPMLAAPVPEMKTSIPRDEAAQRRNASEMVSYNGGQKSTAAKAKNTSTFSGNDANSQFANSAIAAAHTDAATAERIEHLDYTIIQGKIIDCTLETAIDSDLPGTIRAIVSHDTYAEAGRKILIPKGSRMIGTYNSGVKKGQGRVFVIWTRMIRPDGITIDIDSPGIDGLGRAGVEGDVDNKYFEMFSSALLTSSLDIGVAAIGDALFGDGQTTTTNNGNGSSTTSSPTSESMRQAVDSIGTVGKTIVNNTVGLTPTITIDQGTPVNVFVNKELIFPPSITDNQFNIQ